ncbi:unnamed protein product [Soboliphyme baturini]|uniref:RING-type domain-containing protein n=1 Tax=Soboliphyme baturini TaxID=241478 RepID=A0A183IIV2_9BILA|nr:unnamed protein product [Soboliphyme baturini]
MPSYQRSVIRRLTQSGRVTSTSPMRRRSYHVQTTAQMIMRRYTRLTSSRQEREVRRRLLLQRRGTAERATMPSRNEGSPAPYGHQFRLLRNFRQGRLINSAQTTIPPGSHREGGLRAGRPRRSPGTTNREGQAPLRIVSVLRALRLNDASDLERALRDRSIRDLIFNRNNYEMFSLPPRRVMIGIWLAFLIAVYIQEFEEAMRELVNSENLNNVDSLPELVESVFNWLVEAGYLRGMNRRQRPPLPIVPFVGSAAYGQTTCAICLEELLQQAPVTILRCNHIFHPTCIQEWMNQRWTCPSCRQRQY